MPDLSSVRRLCGVCQLADCPRRRRKRGALGLTIVDGDDETCAEPARRRSTGADDGDATCPEPMVTAACVVMGLVDFPAFWNAAMAMGSPNMPPMMNAIAGTVLFGFCSVGTGKLGAMLAAMLTFRWME